MECKTLASVGNWQKLNSTATNKRERDVTRMIAKDAGIDEHRS